MDCHLLQMCFYQDTIRLIDDKYLYTLRLIWHSTQHCRVRQCKVDKKNSQEMLITYDYPSQMAATVEQQCCPHPGANLAQKYLLKCSTYLWRFVRVVSNSIKASRPACAYFDVDVQYPYIFNNSTDSTSSTLAINNLFWCVLYIQPVIKMFKKTKQLIPISRLHLMGSKLWKECLTIQCRWLDSCSFKPEWDWRDYNLPTEVYVRRPHGSERGCDGNLMST
jgi:hypothetical protein